MSGQVLTGMREIEHAMWVARVEESKLDIPRAEELLAWAKDDGWTRLHEEQLRLARRAARPMFGMGYVGFLRLYFGIWMMLLPPVLLSLLLLSLVFDPHGSWYGAGAITCLPVFLVGLLLVRSVPE